MFVKFWGTRGSIPTPGAGTVRYGGNTACVQVVTSSGTQIILDAGTGLRELGHHLVSSVVPPISASILLSHTHWDHIQGVPFFVPMYQGGNSFTYYAGKGLETDLREVLAAQMAYTYFPVSMRQLRGQIAFVEIGEEPIQIGDALVQALYVNHTVVCLGYRITADGASIVYATDHEPYTRLPLKPGGEVLHLGDRRLVAFAQDAELLIHDAQYADEEYSAKAGWGHSTARYAACIALAADVKRLALFHHDPAHDDDFIDSQVERTRALVSNSPAPPEIFAAAEGQELRLAGRQEALVTPAVAPSAAPRRDRRPKILIADDDRMVQRMVQEALAEDGYELLIASDGQEALTAALSDRPDLLILDAVMPKASGFEVCGRLRQDPATSSVPIIMLTSLDEPQFIAKGFNEGASDYLTKPFIGAMLRSRVRSWLVGSGVL